MRPPTHVRVIRGRRSGNIWPGLRMEKRRGTLQGSLCGIDDMMRYHPFPLLGHTEQFCANPALSLGSILCSRSVLNERCLATPHKVNLKSENAKTLDFAPQCFTDPWQKHRTPSFKEFGDSLAYGFNMLVRVHSHDKLFRNQGQTSDEGTKKRPERSHCTA